MTDRARPSTRRLPDEFTEDLSQDFIRGGFLDFFSEDEIQELSKAVKKVLRTLNARIDQSRSPSENFALNQLRLLETTQKVSGLRRWCAVLLAGLAYSIEVSDLLLAEKAFEYLRGSLLATHDDNSLIMALCMRGLLETLGAQLWLIERFNSFKQPLIRMPPIGIPKAIRSTNQLCDQIHRVAYGNKAVYQNPELPSRIQARELRQILPRNLRYRYEELCEFVHPNLGSNVSLRRTSPEISDDAHTLGSPNRHCIHSLINVLPEIFFVLSQIDKIIGFIYVLAERLRNPACPDNRLFLEPAYVHTGDGRTKDSPVCFSDTYSLIEFYAARDAYLEEASLSVERYEVPDGLPPGILVLEAITVSSSVFFDVPLPRPEELVPAHFRTDEFRS